VRGRKLRSGVFVWLRRGVTERGETTFNHRDFSQVEELAYAVEHEQSAHLILSIWFEITFADVERQIHEHSITTLCVLDVSLLVT
jgi:hypothetical protein